jgi:uncharacterized membrane protein (UPF0182 family)
MARPARRRVLIIIAAVLFVLVVALVIASGVYTDLLWFREVGQSTVFTTVLRTKLMLFALFGVVMALVVAANMWLAHRLRPSFRPMSLEQQNLDRYRRVVERHLVALYVGVAAVVGLMAGASASGRWRTWLMWRNGESFGVKDAQFHRDVSYFVFTYPFQRFVLGFLFSVLIVSTIATALMYYLFGGIRMQTQGEKVVASAKAHLSTLLGGVVLLKAYAYYLDQFGLAFSPRGVVTGPSYTDVNAQIPALRILVFVAVICAAIFFVNLRFRGWTFPAVGLVLLLLSSIVIGFVYPQGIQYIRVRPNEIGREAKYIQRNIAATRLAYGLSDVTPVSYTASVTTTPAKVRADKATIPNARLLDPNFLQDTFEQLQGIRGFYAFPKVLDIDRYTIDGKEQSYVVGAREIDLSGLSGDQRNWLNDHLIYTHGYGIAAAPVTSVDPAGRPAFSLKDIPPTGPIRVDQPRIYYGERSTTYGIVGTSQREFDRPAETGGEDQTTTYDGKGGVPIGGTLRRLLYAVKFRDKNLMLSSAVTEKSRILYTREPRDRVKKVAPFLTLDADPYTAVIDGRITWIVDGYTTTDSFPYSQRKNFGEIARDARGNSVSQARINYIRNSVKATVDAYDGTVTLYAWDEKDPLLKVWRNVFPGLVKDRAAMPKSVEAHVRYPEDMFNVQRDLISRYHILDPTGFYRAGDQWGIPDDPSAKTNKSTVGKQPPFYQYLQVPGQPSAAFTLTSPMTANKKANLAAFLTVSSDPEDYGTFRILRLPSQTTINGPAQVASAFESDPRASTELSQLRQGGSTVKLGNLLTLPVAGTFVYVQPVYVQGVGDNSFPVLQRVLVGFGDKVGYAGSLADALEQVFGEGSAPPITEPTGSPSPGGSPSPTTGAAALAEAIADAQKAYADGQAALAKGDFAAYGRAQTRLKNALDRAARASAVGPSAAPSSSASPSTSAQPSPAPSP